MCAAAYILDQGSNNSELSDVLTVSLWICHRCFSWELNTVRMSLALKRFLIFFSDVKR